MPFGRFGSRFSRDPWHALAQEGGPVSVRTLAWGAAGAVALVLAGWATLSAGRAEMLAERDPLTLCRTHVAAPRATLVLVDQTDALAAGSGERFLGLMRRIKADLPQDARVIVVPFDGDLGHSPAPVLDICSPGTGAQANEFIESSLAAQDAYDRRFSAPIDAIARDLQAPHESRYSPIVQQMERVISDPALNWRGQTRELILITDGLQHSPDARIYAGQPMALPRPSPSLLRGVRVRYYELANPERSDLQTRSVREAWRNWFADAGADVRMYAPGYSDQAP